MFWLNLLFFFTLSVSTLWLLLLFSSFLMQEFVMVIFLFLFLFFFVILIKNWEPIMYFFIANFTLIIPFLFSLIISLYSGLSSVVFADGGLISTDTPTVLTDNQVLDLHSNAAAVNKNAYGLASAKAGLADIVKNKTISRLGADLGFNHLYALSSTLENEDVAIPVFNFCSQEILQVATFNPFMCFSAENNLHNYALNKAFIFQYDNGDWNYVQRITYNNDTKNIIIPEPLSPLENDLLNSFIKSRAIEKQSVVTLKLSDNAVVNPITGDISRLVECKSTDNPITKVLINKQKLEYEGLDLQHYFIPEQKIYYTSYHEGTTKSYPLPRICPENIDKFKRSISAIYEANNNLRIRQMLARNSSLKLLGFLL